MSKVSIKEIIAPFASTSLHEEAIANAKAEQRELHDAEIGLNGRNNLEPSRQALEHRGVDRSLRIPRRPNVLAKLRPSAPPPLGCPIKVARDQPPRKWARIGTAPTMTDDDKD